ncbi:MAG: hypothetical protein WBG02_15670 [Candidatus Acidiferrum sp.]
MKLPLMKLMTGLLLTASLTAPAWAVDTSTNSAVPGTLNYVEGQVSMDGQTLGARSIGSAQVQAGESLNTGNGKAELLLTPGVFLRVGDNSAVKMISPSITNTEVGLDHGHVMLEVEQIFPQNDIRITENGATTQILKTGLYDFNSNPGWVRVFDGEAVVEDGGRQVKVKAGHEVDISANGPFRAEKFDRKANEESDLYRWSSLRSAYVAEANVNASGLYMTDGFGPWGPGWWGAGWYWDPWFSAYTFIPGDGIFYSPFGWGFYSPWLVYDAPFFGYGFGYGRFGYVHYYRHFSTDYHTWGPGTHYIASNNYAHGIYRGPGSSGAGFHSGARMLGASHGGAVRGGAVRGGGFRGFGGFHGGGFHGGGPRGR